MKVVIYRKRFYASSSSRMAGAFVASLLMLVMYQMACPQEASAQLERSKLGFVSEDFEVSTVDENGVDVISGSVRISADLVSIGAGEEALTYSVITPSLAQTGTSDSAQMLAVGLPITAGGSSPFKFDNFSGGAAVSGINDCNNWFEIAGSRTDFCGTLAQGLVAADGSNASLEFTGGDYVLTTTDGTKFFSDTNSISNRKMATQIGLSRIEYPNGYEVSIHRGSGRVSILDNRGYQIRITDADTATASIVAFNMAVDYCAPLAASCSFTKSWPTATVYTGSSSQPAVTTDMSGRQTKLYPRARTNGFTGYQFYQVKPAGADESARITYTFCGPWFDTSCAPVNDCNPPSGGPDACTKFAMSANKVSASEKFGKTWTYVFDYYKD
tara:strand:- start:672 stop:1826 length:1155 start_codon:yes stop_codon:yes gene_type:complete